MEIPKKDGIIFSLMMHLETTFDNWDGEKKVIYLPDEYEGIARGFGSRLLYLMAPCSEATGYTLGEPALVTENATYKLKEFTEDGLKKLVKFVQNRESALKKGQKDLETARVRFWRTAHRPRFRDILTTSELVGNKGPLFEAELITVSKSLKKGPLGGAKTPETADVVKDIVVLIDEHPLSYMWLVDVRKVPSARDYLEGITDNPELERIRELLNATRVRLEDGRERYKLLTFWSYDGTEHTNACFYDPCNDDIYVLMSEIEGCPHDLNNVRYFNWVKPASVTGGVDVTSVIYRVVTYIPDDNYAFDIQIVGTSINLIHMADKFLNDSYRVVLANMSSMLVWVDRERRYLFTLDRDVQVDFGSVMVLKKVDTRLDK